MKHEFKPGDRVLFSGKTNCWDETFGMCIVTPYKGTCATVKTANLHVCRVLLDHPTDWHDLVLVEDTRARVPRPLHAITVIKFLDRPTRRRREREEKKNLNL